MQSQTSYLKHFVAVHDKHVKFLHQQPFLNVLTLVDMQLIKTL